MPSPDRFASRSPPRPRLLARACLSLGLFLLLAELLSRGAVARFVTPPIAASIHRWILPVLVPYVAVRAWCLAHPVQAAAIAVALLSLSVAGTRFLLLLWHNQLVPRLAGTHFDAVAKVPPTCNVDLLAHMKARPPGAIFIGLSPQRRWLGWRWTPVYVNERQRSMHRHVVGKTGSGKTLSVLWPQVLQDALDGKGVLVFDAKGSDENVRTMMAIAAASGRMEQLRVFALPAWSRPGLLSHAYNMLHVRPRTPTDSGGDVSAMAERVFSVLTLGDNAYYNVQAELAFGYLCKLLHGMTDDAGQGLAFNMQDVAVCLRGVGTDGPFAKALSFCLQHSTDRAAASELEALLTRLGRDAPKCLSGLMGAVEKFQAPLVNAYAPELVFEEVLQQNLLVYVQLPANLYKLQAPALGRVMLMDVQQEGSLRQVHRKARNQRPFSVVVDEFYNFADLSIVDSLNKLRDAHLEFTLAHQSLADLELVSKEFATAVWDNTRTKDILSQDNPELCERLAKSIGTHQVVELTVRREHGVLFTSLITGDASSKLVEAYRLHPNAIKSLARAGQGYHFSDEAISPVSYPMLPAFLRDAEVRLKVTDQRTARGLRLYERFVVRTGP